MYFKDWHLQVFHAGTSTNKNGDVIAVGGRVLGVTAMGKDVLEAQQKAYQVDLREIFLSISMSSTTITQMLLV